MTLVPGTQLGAYEILSLLGEGGMGQVYRARDTRLLRDVAVKILPESLQHDSAAVARFEREWRAVSALNHPNICTLYDAGPHYLVTELIEGETLRDVLLGRSAPERCLEIARQVLEALGAAHRAGIIHRDLKPSNIMVRHDGYVKLLDFGLVKKMIPSSVQDTVTGAPHGEVSVSGQFVGTLAYMSPEQIVGAPIGPRSDLFSFGIILYEMLAGVHPWQQPSLVDTLHAILHDPPPVMDQATPIRTALAPIIQRLLCKDPAARFPSAEAVLDAFTRQPTPSSTTPADPKPLTSIAVLPFVFLDEPEHKGFSLGFADALITVLGSLEDVAVLPTSAILHRAAGAADDYARIPPRGARSGPGGRRRLR